MNGKTSHIHGQIHEQFIFFYDNNSLQTDLHIPYNPYQSLSCLFFKEIDKLILKFIWKWKDPESPK